MHQLAKKYLRTYALPTFLCPGCGIGTVLGCVLRALDSLGNFEKTAIVSGIGCSSMAASYINTGGHPKH